MLTVRYLVEPTDGGLVIAEIVGSTSGAVPEKRREMGLELPDAEALCRALAAHLGIDVAPRGWRANEYSKDIPNDTLSTARQGRGWYCGSLCNERLTSGPYDTAEEACVAVEALSRDTATEPDEEDALRARESEARSHGALP